MITSACVRFYLKNDATMYEIPCHRHADAFEIISQFISMDAIDKTKTKQGFLTHENIFLDRYEAMQEAIKWNQLLHKTDEVYAELYSEDLW